MTTTNTTTSKQGQDHSPVRKTVASTFDHIGDEYSKLVRARPAPHLAVRSGRSKYLKKLFPDQTQLVCLGHSYKTMITAHPDVLEPRLYAFNFVVPAYMKTSTGVTIVDPHLGLVSRRSTHCIENIGPVRFVVYRNSKDTLDDQAHMILRLSVKAPLVMVVRIDGKILEAWFSVMNWGERRVRVFQETAMRWGSWSKTQFPLQPYALPGGYSGRDIYCRNELVYFDPDAIDTSPPSRGKNIRRLQ